MSETIIGSKSSFYIREAIPGVSDSVDELTHQSVQNLWNARGAADVLIHALYATTAIPLLIGAGSVRRKLEVTAHGAIVGDFIRINNGNAESEEVAIIKIIDANNLVIAKEINAAIGDELFIMKNVTPTYNKDGSLNVSSGPIQFIKDAVATQVIEDTAVPANNIGLPVRNIDSSGLPIDFSTLTEQQLQTIELQDINTELDNVVTELQSIKLNTDGLVLKDSVYNDYAITPVDNAAWVQVIAATSDDIKKLTVFDSGGFPLELGVGGVGLETKILNIPPGGLNGEISSLIPTGSRLSVRSLTANDSVVGDLIINLLG